MSIKPTPASSDPELATATESFTIANAPRIFDPFNTRDCPGMFDDKWADTGDGASMQ